MIHIGYSMDPLPVFEKKSNQNFIFCQNCLIFLTPGISTLIIFFPNGDLKFRECTFTIKNIGDNVFLYLNYWLFVYIMLKI